MCLEPVLHTEAHALQQRGAPQLEKPARSNEDQVQPKLNKLKKVDMYLFFKYNVKKYIATKQLHFPLTNGKNLLPSF